MPEWPDGTGRSVRDAPDCRRPWLRRGSRTPPPFPRPAKSGTPRSSEVSWANDTSVIHFLRYKDPFSPRVSRATRAPAAERGAARPRVRQPSTDADPREMSTSFGPVDHGGRSLPATPTPARRPAPQRRTVEHLPDRSKGSTNVTSSFGRVAE